MEISNVVSIELGLGEDILGVLTKAAVVGGLGVGVDGNLHTNVSSSDGGKSSNEERNGSVGEV